KAAYRIIGDRITFEKLFLLSNKSKFFMAGELYNFKKPFFDFRFHSHLDLGQARQMFHLGPEMSGGGFYKAVYKGTFENFQMQGSGDFKKITFYDLPIDTTTFDLDMTENWLDITNIKSTMFDGTYDGAFSIRPLKGNAIFKASGTMQNWDGLKLCRFIRMNDMRFPVKASAKTAIEWTKHGGIKNLTGTMEV